MVNAIVLEKPETIKMREFDSKVPDDGVLLSVGAAGICGTDAHIYDGSLAGVTYPVIMGHEISGTIKKIGKNAKINSFDHLSVGDRVAVTPGIPCRKCYYCKMYPHMENYCKDRITLGSNYSCKNPPHLFGGFAEEIIIPAGFWLHKLPENVPLDLGALAEPLAVAVRAVGRMASPGLPYTQMGMGIGSSLVVQGAGAIGTLTAICAKLSGVKVIVLDKIQSRLDIVKEFGVEGVINVSGKTDDDLIDIIKEIHNGVGPDAVIEATGELEAVTVGIKMVRRGGRYIELGHFADVGEIKMHPSYICRNDLEFVGSVLGSPQDYVKVLHILSKSNLPLNKIITNRFRLDDTEKGLLNSRERKGMKTMIIPKL
jgi:L-iditol 2-dehydrogenase